MLFYYYLKINHLNLCPAVTVASCHQWASKSINLLFTEPMKVLALVLGSKLTNHWGIVLAFFVYIHFVPNLKFGAKVYIFINVRKTALSDCLRQILFLNYRKFEIFNLDGCKVVKISVLYRIICSLQNEWPIVVRP